MSHEVVLGGKLAARTSFSLSRPSSPRVEDLKGEPGSCRAAPEAFSPFCRGPGVARVAAG